MASVPEPTSRTRSALLAVTAGAGRHRDPDRGAGLRGEEAFPASGGAAATYAKRHLIPGLESELTEGDGPPVVLPGGLGLIICKDLDFPDLVRQDRNADASVLLAPAWDMGSDGWLHGRMAIVRGVESGASVARSGRNGLLTISNPTGDVTAEADAVRDPDTAIVADVPTGTTPTLYARIGDWFAWLCTAATVLLALLTTRKRRNAPTNVPPDNARRPENPSANRPTNTTRQSSLRELQRRAGVTTVFVTHDQDGPGHERPDGGDEPL